MFMSPLANRNTGKTALLSLAEQLGAQLKRKKRCRREKVTFIMLSWGVCVCVKCKDLLWLRKIMVNTAKQT